MLWSVTDKNGLCYLKEETGQGKQCTGEEKKKLPVTLVQEKYKPVLQRFQERLVWIEPNGVYTTRSQDLKQF